MFNRKELNLILDGCELAAQHLDKILDGPVQFTRGQRKTLNARRDGFMGVRRKALDLACETVPRNTVGD